MKIRILAVLSILSLSLSAQDFVSMSNQTPLLNGIIGFGYNDCIVDMNGDFLDDVVRVTSERLYIDFQQADGSFTQQEFPIDFVNLPGWSICAGDIDGNGFNDLLFGDGSAVSFVMANADGTAYTEHTAPGFIFSQRSTFADIDNDGHLDAFVCHDVDQSKPYRNDGMGNLVEDQTLIETIDQPGNYAAIWCDYDNDNDIDLYVTKCQGGAAPGNPNRTNRLYQNNGDGTYSEVGETAGLDDNAQSWSTVFEDFDNDGDFDAFIVNHDFQNRFFLNNGDGTFTDIIDATGINPNDLGAWENASGDFNNDGYVDIFSELNQELYLNNGDLTFTGQNLPVDPGAIGDLNNDGFLDVFANGSLWLNDGNENNWLKVNTIGVESNLNGIGARVEIYGDWGVQIREVRAGQSFAPMSSLQIHFGIGEATEADLLVVKWPSGTVTTIENPEINTTHDVSEAGCLLPGSQLIVVGETSICPGESVTLEAPAGFDEVTWSNGASGQTITVSEPGNYSAVLTDGMDCVSFSNTVAVTIIEEVPPSIEILGEDKFCKGEEVTLTASGGTDYTWSNGMTGETITVGQQGTYTVATIGVCTGEPLASESVTIEVLEAPLPITEQFLGAVVGTTLTLTADGQGGEVHWYGHPTGTVLLAVGDTFETPPMPWGEIFFYAESVHTYNSQEQPGGKPDNAGPGGLPSQGAYTFFDAWQPFTIASVRVYVPDDAPSGVRNIQLMDEFENLLDEATFELEPGEHVLELEFEVPVGTNFTLRCPQNDLFRNSGGVQYPYPIGDDGELGELTTSFFGDDYYYYFYDWKVRGEAIQCRSERVEISVTGFDATQEELAEAGISIFPNPASTQLFVKIENPATVVRLFDATGREVLRSEVTGNETVTLDVSDFAAGFYSLQLEVDGKVLTGKVVVE